ncbi:MAG: cupin domain-containing protein [Pseudomonadota bacterium]
MAQASALQHVDNERVRVTEWRFGIGDNTGWHRHEFDYVITPVTGASVELIDAEGARSQAEMVPGQSYFRAAGVEHDVINLGPGPLVFVETELKEPPK